VVMLADGGDCLSDPAVLWDQPELFGRVASSGPDHVLSSSCGLGELRRERWRTGRSSPGRPRSRARPGSAPRDVPVGAVEAPVADRQGGDFRRETVLGEGRTRRWVGVGSACDLVAGVSPGGRACAQCNNVPHPAFLEDQASLQSPG
jgi:hypothetical protein